MDRFAEGEWFFLILLNLFKYYRLTAQEIKFLVDTNYLLNFCTNKLYM